MFVPFGSTARTATSSAPARFEHRRRTCERSAVRAVERHPQAFEAPPLECGEHVALVALEGIGVRLHAAYQRVRRRGMGAGLRWLRRRGAYGWDRRTSSSASSASSTLSGSLEPPAEKNLTPLSQ